VNFRAVMMASNHRPLIISLNRKGAPSQWSTFFPENHSDRLYPAVVAMYNQIPMNCRNSPNVMGAIESFCCSPPK
jgi:hypothetical protein